MFGSSSSCIRKRSRPIAKPPFYADYLEDDLAGALREVGFAVESSEPQFVAKVVVARRP
jgi:hypothetical protein